MILGCHVNFTGQQLYGAVLSAISLDANALMCYTGAPQNTLRKPIDDNLTIKAHKLMQENNISLDNVICHAPYIVNLANKDKWNFSINFLKEEVKRCDKMGIKYMVLHPGNAVGISKEEGIQNIINGLNLILDTKDKCTILLETMAGKGTECGINIQELKTIINGIIKKNRIGVCLDTCHLNDSGIDVSNFDSYLNIFETEIGLKYIHCLHLNDSKNELGSHKDRHANIGYGTIGFNNLVNVLNNPKLKDVPKILETPYYGNNPPYKFEIEMLKSSIFNPNLEADVNSFYK